jgi:hypothetical protein
MLPLPRRLPEAPPIWEDHQAAPRACDALPRGPPRLALKAERVRAT